MAKLNVAEFAQQVRQEAARVTWPSRKETMVTTGMVFLMVFIAATAPSVFAQKLGPDGAPWYRVRIPVSVLKTRLP